MLGKLFSKKGKSKKGGADSQTKALQQIEVLNNKIGELDKKIEFLEKQVKGIEGQVKEALKGGNKKLAKQLLVKKKKLNEQIKQNEGAQMMMEEQKSVLESTESMKSVYETMKSTNEVMKEVTGDFTADKMEDVRDEMEDIKANNEEISNIFSSYQNDAVEDPEVEEELAKYEGELENEAIGELPSANKDTIKVSQVENKPEEEDLNEFLA